MFFKKKVFLVFFQLFIFTELLQSKINTCVNFLDPNIKQWRTVSSIFESTARGAYFYYQNESVSNRNLNLHRNGHIKWLLALGFKFEIGNSGKLIAPPLSELCANYESSIRNQVKKFNEANPKELSIKDEDIIHIGFEFLNKKGSSISLKFGEPIPKGYEFSGRFTPGQKLYFSLARGMFPLSFGNYSYHDFSHLSGYLEHPEYMAAYKKIAQRISSRYNGLIYKSNPGLSYRVYYFNESLILASKAEVEKNIRLFKLPLDFNSDFTNPNLFTLILSEIQSLSPEELLENTEQFLNKAPSLILEMGGASRDEIHFQDPHFHYINYVLKQIEFSLKKFKKILERKEKTKNLAITNERSIRNQLERRLAALQTNILILSEITPNQWADFIVQDNFSESGVSLFFETQKVVPIYNPSGSAYLQNWHSFKNW